MKKILACLATLAAMIAAGGAQAQKVSVSVGYASESLPSFAVVGGSQVISPNLTGFYLNAQYTYNFSTHWGVTAGLGGRYNTRDYPSYLTMIPATTQEMQIVVDVPVLLSFTVPMSDYADISLFVGPMVSFGAIGTSTITESLYGNSVKADWYGPLALYKRLNVQGTGGIAVDVKHLRLFGGYSMGILNLSPAEGKTINTSALYLGLGVTF